MEFEKSLKILDSLYENKRQLEILEDYIVRNNLHKIHLDCKEEDYKDIGYNFMPNSLGISIIAKLLIQLKKTK